MKRTKKNPNTKSNDIQLFHGNSLDVLKALPDNSVDAVVSDPPYGIAFMGKDWDKALPPVEIWAECFRVLKPGGYILAMSATRTYHRLGVQLEDLGFIVHPMIGWIFGSGFPKATDLSKQYGKQAGAKREVVGKNKYAHKGDPNGKDANTYNIGTLVRNDITAPSTVLAKQWDQWKYGLQSLKPALEPIFMGQKPISEKRMTDNVKKWGVGAVNIGACRVGRSENDRTEYGLNGIERKTGNVYGKQSGAISYDGDSGRFPANLIHDGSDEVIEGFPSSKSQPNIKINKKIPENNLIGLGIKESLSSYHNDEGSNARFFYCAKPSKKERNAGCEAKNNHSTVKPLALMNYLIKLVTPPGGTTLDPFMGSGTTGVAAKQLGFKFIGIEMDKNYFKICQHRINHAKKK